MHHDISNSCFFIRAVCWLIRQYVQHLAFLDMDETINCRFKNGRVVAKQQWRNYFKCHVTMYRLKQQLCLRRWEKPGDGKMPECLLEIRMPTLALSENEVSDRSCRINIQQLWIPTWHVWLHKPFLKQHCIIETASRLKCSGYTSKAVLCVFPIVEWLGCVISLRNNAYRLDAVFILNRFGRPLFLGAAAA